MKKVSFIFLILLNSLSLLRAEDLTTLDGHIFTNITDIAKFPTMIFFSYNGDRKPIALTNLPEDFRNLHGIIIKTNAPVIAKPLGQQQMSPVDLFLWQNRESELEQRADESITTNLWTLGSNTAEKYKGYSITLKSAEVSLSLFSVTRFYEKEKEKLSDKVETTDEMSFDSGKEDYILKVFEKFLDWENVASTNNAEDFEKEIVRRIPNKAWAIYHQEMFGDAYANEVVIYTFEWKNKQATLNVQSPDPYTGNFEREDIIHFRSLLKQLPSMKEKLAHAIQSKDAQKDLFK